MFGRFTILPTGEEGRVFGRITSLPDEDEEDGEETTVEYGVRGERAAVA